MLAIGACGATAASVAEPTHDPDVRALLPDGATQIVLVRPAELYATVASGTILRALASDAQLEALRVQHGIDLRTLERAAYASYESPISGGDVIILQGPFRAEVAVAEIAHRMIPVESREEAPRSRAGGMLRGTRIDAIALGAHTLAIVIGPPTLTGRVIRAAEGSTPPAIAGAVQQALGRYAEPFVATRPVPFALPDDTPVGRLLSEEESMVIAVAPSDTAELHVTADLSGGFPPSAEENFRQLVTSLARSTLGTALGLRTALGTLTVEATPSRVLLHATLDANEVAHGLEVLFRAEIAEMLVDAPIDGDPTPPSDMTN